MKLKRIQLRRTRGWKMPAGAVKCDRTTALGNPFQLKDFDKPEECIEAFRDWVQFAVTTGMSDGCLADGVVRFRKAIVKLDKQVRAGEVTALACWCKPGPCHCDVLIEILEGRR